MFTKLSQELAHIGDIDAHQHRTFKQNSLKSIDYEFFNFLLDDEIFHRKYSSSLKASSYKNVAELDVNQIDVDRLYNMRGITSVSRIENFNKCPYQYFMNYGIKPTIIQDFNFNALDVGNIFHFIFEKMMNYMMSVDVKININEENITSQRI